MNVYELENGLKVYCYHDSSKHSAFVSLGVFYGGIDTDFIRNGKHYHYPDGMAHLLEHYLCEQNRFGNIINCFRDFHMYANAATSMKNTYFYFDAVTDIEKGLEYLIQGIHSPIFTNENLEEVKHAVKEEILKKQDLIGRRIHEKAMENLFHNISMRNNIGTIDEISSIDLEMLQTCYETFYQPGNEVLIIAGNFEEEKVLNKVKKLYSTLKFSNYRVEKYEFDEPKEVVHHTGLIEMPTGNNIYELVFKVPLHSFSKDQYLDLEVGMYNLLGMNFDLPTKTYQKLKDKGIIKTSIMISTILMKPFYIVHIGAYTDKPEEFKKEILKVLKCPIIDEEMFELDQKNRKMSIAMRPDSLQHIVFPLQENIFVFDYPDMDKVEDVDKLSFEKMKNIIAQLDFSHYTEIRVVDVKK